MKDAILAYLEVVDRVGGYSHREHDDALQALRDAVTATTPKRTARKPAAKKAPRKKLAKS